MNRELLLKAFGDIDEGFIAEAYRPLPEAAASPAESRLFPRFRRLETRPPAHRFPLAALWVLQSIWQLASVVSPPRLQAVT